MRDIEPALQDLTMLAWNERATSSGTAGTYLKARTGTGRDMIYYKLSRFNGIEIDGHECVNEIVAGRLMDILGIPHLTYRLIHANVNLDGKAFETWLNASRTFRKPGERKQALGTFFDLHRLPDETPFSFCARQGWRDQIAQMMLVDYLIANRDRHASNIEVLVSRTGGIRLAPIFDNGLSLVAPLAGLDDLIDAFDPLKPVATMNFIGSRSLEENLEAIAPVPGLGVLHETDRAHVLGGLQGIIPDRYLDKIWDIIWQRWQHYEDIRDHR